MSYSWARRVALCLATGLLAAGCSRDTFEGLLVSNRRPSVEFTHAPISVNASDPDFYAYRVFWAGDDPDGRVVGFEYCIDPTPTDSVWTRTDRAEELIFFRATEPEPRPGPVPRATGLHVLVLRAVDNEGAHSPFKTRGFYSYTIAPSVQIRNPAPSGLLQAAIVPSVFIRWEGQDPDGQLHDKPVYYRHKLFSLANPEYVYFLSHPDSLRRRYGANGFAEWDSSGAESTFVRLTDLTPGNQYLFVVVAFDEAGAYSPVFSLYENMLQMFVTYAVTIGPRIHMFNEFIDFTYDSGGYTVDPLRWVTVEAAAGTSLRFSWDAIPSPGSAMDHYRWALDLIRIDDPTPRFDEELDLQHWSRPSPLTKSCVLPPLPVGRHFLYVEATDNNDLASLGIVEIVIVAPTFEKDLLIVDDTRREVDKLTQTGLETYKSFWPSATELDTFLFARGGYPWRKTQVPGAISPPGVFAGYRFDTLGTRQGREIPARGTPLATLTRYRHVIWIVDEDAASMFDVFGANPMAVLRYVGTPGRASPLGAYLRAGGRIWLFGGAAATASVDAYNVGRNDDSNGKIYAEREGELGPGRVMFDGAHWRSAFCNRHAAITVARAPRADAIAEAPWTHEDRWTGTPLTAPDYRRLPEEMRYRDPGTDPLPPTRLTFQSQLYYLTAITLEYLIEPNSILEKVDRSSGSPEISVLDTLYEARSFALRTNPAPTMTWYHGNEANRFVFSGFAPWDFRREDCIGLVDFVLQDLWRLPRQGVTRAPAGQAVARPVARVRPVAPVTRAVVRR